MLIVLFLLVVPLPLHAADAAITLPLGGYYRPGRYMPVRIVAHTDGPDATLTLRATGALTTELRSANGRIDALAPWLSLRTVKDVRWQASGEDHPVDLPLHALDDDECLIGYVGADPDVLTPFFPGKKPVRIALEVADPMPGAATAWESLDGIVLDAAAASRIEQSKVRDLLAGGAAIAIRSRQMPGGDWPWKRRGQFWIAKIDIAGPTSADAGEAYLPTQVWQRGWPEGLRHWVLGAAVGFALLVTAVALWRSRWMTAGVVAVAIAGTLLILVWRARLSVSIETGGLIIARTDATTQRDAWTYRAVLRESDGVMAWEPSLRPVFAWSQQADQIAAAMVCAADGHPSSIRYHLQPRMSLAFQSRSLLPERQVTPMTTPLTTPMRLLADALYLRRRDRISGQSAAVEDEHWPGVVIDRPARIEKP